jgi:hypothetical protein
VRQHDRTHITTTDHMTASVRTSSFNSTLVLQLSMRSRQTISTHFLATRHNALHTSFLSPSLCSTRSSTNTQSNARAHRFDVVRTRSTTSRITPCAAIASMSSSESHSLSSTSVVLTRGAGAGAIVHRDRSCTRVHTSTMTTHSTITHLVE